MRRRQVSFYLTAKVILLQGFQREGAENFLRSSKTRQQIIEEITVDELADAF